MAVRTTQQVVEQVIEVGTPKARVTQQVAEMVLQVGMPKARVTQQVVELLITPEMRPAFGVFMTSAPTWRKKRRQ